MADPQKFRSPAGARPTFFVPDTGSAGGSAVLTGPGINESFEHSQTTMVDGDGKPRDPHPDWGHRVGFEMPFALTEVGEYVLTITQDDVETTYEIEVYPDPDAKKKGKDS